jgi:purine-nucleoside/S-methyl-5'-thioadenosine phosphorylase / adenosine deaminase
MTEIPLPGARAFFSTRQGGVSEGPYESLNLGILTDDVPERVAENRRRVAASAGLGPDDVAMGWQVHGTDIREWDAAPERPWAGYAHPGDELPRVDGHLTSAPGVGLLVLVADCLPVALAGDGRAAMLHCGWRGLAGGILERALESFDTPPAAAVGPGIGPCCYEVGEEVLERFRDLDWVASGRMLDLRAIADHKLRAAGVDSVEHVEHCTSCREDLYFSHRRDGGVTGRQAGLVVRE